MLATVIDFLSLYCLISNQPVARLIIVTHFKGGILTPFMLLLMLYGPMRLMHNLSDGIASAPFQAKVHTFWIVSFEFDKWRMSKHHSLSVLSFWANKNVD
jgi:hypothetical protein